MPRSASRPIRIHRIAPWSRNRLMRSSDRLQAAWRMVAVLVAVASIPLAVVVGISAATTTGAHIRAGNAAKTAVAATVISDPLRIAVPVGQGVVASGPLQATVEWNIHGRTDIAVVVVPNSAKRGSTVTQWLDSSGRATSAPRPTSDAVVQGIDTAVLTVIATCCAAAVLVWCADRILLRRHHAAWAREWRDFAPGIGHNNPS
ncbi:Rv1733c family protein [Nocardia sp. CA-151230]|uniref:Rv1733c family protein n=1 Tax=Nocardia sp. CA-151230 TaxID=3239982 RepID=UPI003D90E047